MKALKAAEKVRVRLDTIQPEKDAHRGRQGRNGGAGGTTQGGGSPGRTGRAEGQGSRSGEPAAARDDTLDEGEVREAQAQQKIREENQRLQMDMVYLQEQLEEERSFSARLLAGIDAALDYLWEHLPEPLRPIIEKAQQLIPVPDVQKPEQKQERGHSWGDMSL